MISQKPQVHRNRKAGKARVPDGCTLMTGFSAVTHLVACDDLTLDGLAYYPAFDTGPARFDTLRLKGYVWPYLRLDQMIDEQPVLWFMLLGFKAPTRWLQRFLNVKRDVGFQLAGNSNELWKVHRQPLSDRLAALVPQHPDRSTNPLLQWWRQRSATQFLRMGGIGPNEAKVVMSTLPCPDPMFW